MMVDDFVDDDNQIFCPCFVYYHKQFLDPYGYLHRLKNSTIVAQIFEPFLLREDSVDILHALSDELEYFVRDINFTPNIISSLKKSPLGYI